MVSRLCPVCESEQPYQVFAEAAFDASRWGRFAFASRKTPEYMHYRLLACESCDLLYANPLPTRESLQQAYEEAAFDSAAEARCASETYAGLLPPILARLPERRAALDIGTGDGAFLAHLVKAGFQKVVGVEPSHAPVASAPAEIRPLIQQGAFDPGTFEPKSLSLITCFQTLEHVYDPRELCQAASNLLRPGGALLVVCHDRRALSARLLRKRSPIFDIEHLQLFSHASLSQLFKRTGFGGVSTQVVVNQYPLAYWARLFPLPPRVKKATLAMLERTSLGQAPVRLSAGNFAAVGYKSNTESTHLSA